MQLDAAARHRHGGLGRAGLGAGDDGAARIAGGARIERGGGGLHAGARQRDLHGEVGGAVLQRLEGADDAAELLARLQVVRGHGKGALHAAEQVGGGRQRRLVQRRGERGFRVLGQLRPRRRGSGAACRGCRHPACARSPHRRRKQAARRAPACRRLRAPAPGTGRRRPPSARSGAARPRVPGTSKRIGALLPRGQHHRLAGQQPCRADRRRRAPPAARPKARRGSAAPAPARRRAPRPARKPRPCRGPRRPRSSGTRRPIQPISPICRKVARSKPGSLKRRSRTRFSVAARRRHRGGAVADHADGFGAVVGVVQGGAHGGSCPVRCRDGGARRCGSGASSKSTPGAISRTTKPRSGTMSSTARLV